MAGLAQQQPPTSLMQQRPSSNVEALPDYDFTTPFGGVVRTPYPTAVEVFKKIGVNSESTVLDLGCAFGHPCIAAAREFGAKSIGVEIELDAVQKFQAKIEQAKLGHLVTAIHADALVATELPTIREARLTHIFLYVLEGGLRQLLPVVRVLQERHPGLVIASAFRFPAPNEPSEVFATSQGTQDFRVYRDLLVLPSVEKREEDQKVDAPPTQSTTGPTVPLA